MEFVDCVDPLPEDTEVEANSKPNVKGQYSEISPHDLSNSKIVDEKFNDEVYDFQIDVNQKKRSQTQVKKKINIMDEDSPYQENLARTYNKNVLSPKKDKTVVFASQKSEIQEESESAYGLAKVGQILNMIDNLTEMEENDFGKTMTKSQFTEVE